MTLGEMRDKTGNHFDWTGFLNAYIEPMELPMKFTDEDAVLVMDLAYYTKVVPLLAQTPVHVILNYQVRPATGVLTYNVGHWMF